MPTTLPIPGQIIPQGVASYYEGKALRLQQALGEKELEQADEKLELAERRVAVDERIAGIREREAAAQERELFRELTERSMTAGLQAYEAAEGTEEERRAAGSEATIAALDAMLPGGVDEVYALLEKTDPSFSRASPKFVPSEAEAAIADPDQYREIQKQLATQKPSLQNFGSADGVIDETHVVGSEGYYDAINRGKHAIGPASQVERTADVTSQLTNAGVNQVTIDFRNKVNNAQANAQTATELVEISYSSPEALAKSGAIVNFGSEVYSTAKALFEAYNPGAELTEKQKQGWAAYDWRGVEKATKSLGLSARQAARMKSGIYSIAFSAAVGEQGSRPSDKDIQQYIDIYGGNVTNPDAFRGTIAQALRRQGAMLEGMAELNPEIEDSDHSLAVWERAYGGFLNALEGGTSRGAGTGGAPTRGRIRTWNPQTGKFQDD